MSDKHRELVLMGDKVVGFKNKSPEEKKQYIITEEQLTELETRKNYQTGRILIYASIYQLGKDVRSHPYNPQAEREKVLDELTSWMKGRYDLPALKEKIAELRQEGKVEK